MNSIWEEIKKHIRVWRGEKKREENQHWCWWCISFISTSMFIRFFCALMREDVFVNNIIIIPDQEMSTQEKRRRDHHHQMLMKVSKRKSLSHDLSWAVYAVRFVQNEEGIMMPWSRLPDQDWGRDKVSPVTCLSRESMLSSRLFPGTSSLFETRPLRFSRQTNIFI